MLSASPEEHTTLAGRTERLGMGSLIAELWGSGGQCEREAGEEALQKGH
jgi:hypothetical protein